MLTMETDDGRRFTLRSRWGHGTAAHPQLAAVLERGRTDYERLLAEIEQHGEVLRSIRQEHDPNSPLAPCWNNIWFTALDATMLVSFLLSRRPKNYLEIGSGNSTMFTSHTRHAANLPTIISSIDPRPRAEIDSICQRKIRAPLEDCDLTLFDELSAGDILFFDGSHRVFMNSDVTVFFLEVIQRLKPGVLVHIHDIFLPYDYPADWAGRYYTEQYLLATALLLPDPGFDVVCPNQYIVRDPQLSRVVDREIGPRAHGHAGSFWLQTRVRT